MQPTLVDNIRKHAETPEEAQKHLLQILRLNERVPKTIGAPRQASDRELLEALARYESAFAALRSAGCDVATATYGAWLLPVAMKAPMKGAPRRRCPRFRHVYCWFCMVFTLASVLMVLAPVVAMHSKAGWESGTCNLALFDNGTCVQPGGCRFQVNLYNEGKGKSLVKQEWQPPVARSYYDNKAFFVGSAMRCCDLGETFACCDLYDVDERRFCDNWPHRADAEGEPCPAGNWPCLYRTAEADDAEVIAIEPYDAPTIWPLIVSSTVMYCFLASCSWSSTRPYRERFNAFRKAKVDAYNARRKKVREAAQAIADAEAALEAAELAEESEEAEDPTSPGGLSQQSRRSNANGGQPRQLSSGGASSAGSTAELPGGVPQKEVPRRSQVQAIGDTIALHGRTQQSAVMEPSGIQDSATITVTAPRSPKR